MTRTPSTITWTRSGLTFRASASSRASAISERGTELAITPELVELNPGLWGMTPEEQARRWSHEYFQPGPITAKLRADFEAERRADARAAQKAANGVHSSSTPIRTESKAVQDAYLEREEAFWALNGQRR